jgi:hemerythrin-like domain-containing protein
MKNLLKRQALPSIVSLGNLPQGGQAMRYVDPLDILREEHSHIMAVLDVLESANALQAEADLYADALSFLLECVDQSHHQKEEKSLFPRLATAGPPTGALRDLRRDHEAIHDAIEQMRGALQRGDVALVRAIVADYVDLMRDHIEREELILFPMCQGILTDEKRRAIHDEFVEMTGGLFSPEELNEAVEHLRADLEELEASMQSRPSS